MTESIRKARGGSLMLSRTAAIELQVWIRFEAVNGAFTLGCDLRHPDRCPKTHIPSSGRIEGVQALRVLRQIDPP